MDYSSFVPIALREGELGHVARALRERRGLTLRAAAAELGVSASALSQAEHNGPGVERLALRAVNGHLSKAATEGLLDPGHVRLQFQAYGGAKDVVSEIRKPDTSRAVGLLRQALMARGLNLIVGGGGEHARIDVADSAIRVDLGSMMASLPVPGRAGITAAGPLGYVVDLEESTLDDEVWAQSIDRFAGALVSCSASGRLDAVALRDALRRPLPVWFAPTSPDEPMA